MNKNFIPITITLFFSSFLGADSLQLQQARTDLLAGRFNDADQALHTLLNNESQNTEARLLKCLSEAGRFFETTLADFLINTLGTDSTRTSEALSGTILLDEIRAIKPVPYPIYDPENSANYIYDWTTPAYGLREASESEPGGNWLDQLFNYQMESETTVPMTRQNGIFSTPEGARRCGLTFKFTGTTAEQVNFRLTFNSFDYNAPLKVYFNGIAIGQIYQNSGYLVLGEGPLIYLNSSNYLSLRMQNGDHVSFEVEQSDRSNTTTPGTTSLSIESLDPWVLSHENGVLYSSYFPILKAGANLNDLSDFFLGTTGSFTSLLSSIQTHLQAIPSDGSATFLPVDTGMPIDLIIEAADVQVMLALVEALQAFQILCDAYDYNLDLSKTNYQNLLQNLLNLDDFERLLPTLFDVRSNPEQPVTQAKTLLDSALNRYLSNESILWNRSSEAYNAYLFEIDSNNTTRSQQDWSAAVSSSINSLSNFTAAKNVAPSVKSGFEFTLSPLFGASAFDIKADLLAENWDDSDYSLYHFAAENGFVQKLLPPTFDGMCLARFNEIGEIHEVDFIYKTDTQYWLYQYNYGHVTSPYYDPFEGTLVLAPNRTTKRYTGSSISSDQYEYLQLTAETEYGGTWEMLSYNLGENTSTANTGRYVLYPGVLDMDNDGMPDGQQLLQGFRVLPPTTLSSNDIAQSEYGLSKTYQPASLAGKVLVADDDPTVLNSDPSYGITPKTYSLSFVSRDQFSYLYMTHETSLATMNYSYYQRLAQIADLTNRNNPLHVPHKFITFYKSPYEGAGFSITEDYMLTNKYFSFALYPATLDLDNNGATDGAQIMQIQELDFDRLPRQIDIETVTNKALDTDEDGLPDLLEARFGGSETNPNDTNITTAYLLDNDLYTLSEAESMGVNSGINQVVQNPESFNLYTADSIKEMKLSGMTLGPVVGDKVNINYTVEESQTLGEWSTHSTGTMEIQLPEGNRFIRMRVEE
jgi:hypothetical protein